MSRIVILILFFIYPLDSISEAKLTINLEGYNHPWYLMKPLDRAFDMLNSEILDPKSKNKFRFSLQNDTEGFVYLFYRFQVIPIFFTPDSRVEVILKEGEKPAFQGDHVQENEYLLKYPRRLISPYSKSSSAESLESLLMAGNNSSAFKEWKKRLSSHIEELKNQCKDCDSRFISLMKNELPYYFANKFVRSIFNYTKNKYASSDIIWKKTENFSEKDIEDIQDFKSNWEIVWNSINQYVLTRETPIIYSHDYLSFLRAYYDVYRLGYKKEKPDKYKSTSQRSKLILELAESELSEKLFETFYAFELEFLKGAGTVIYTDTYLHLCEDFKARYPNSAHLPFIAPIIKESKAFLEKSTDITYEQTFLSSESFTSLQTIKDNFRHRPVYIDMWATWCKPCLEEFAYQDHLYDLLIEKEILLLYISVDKPEDQEKWKEFIGRFNLKGNHLLANKFLIDDIWLHIGDSGQKGYPRYIIIDEEGKIMYKNAARPSQKDLLEMQLNHIIKNK